MLGPIGLSTITFATENLNVLRCADVEFDGVLVDVILAVKIGVEPCANEMVEVISARL